MMKVRTYSTTRNSWFIDNYKEISILMAAFSSLMYTFGYLIKALKFHS